MRPVWIFPGVLLFILGCTTPPAAPTLGANPSTRTGVAVFKRSGQQLVVEAVLNHKVRADFLVDTGADLTIIPTAVAKDLGIQLHSKLPTVRLYTISQSVAVPLVVLDSIDIAGMKADDVTVAVHDSPIFDGYLSGPPGLLGRDFLNRFRVQIDLNEGFLRLEPKP